MKIDKEKLRRVAYSGIATILIIAVGIGVPGLLIRNMTRAEKLPQGDVNIAEVQPFGAEVIQRERFLLDAVQDFSSSHSLVTYNDIRTVNKANAYSELGIQSSLYGGLDSGRPEFLSSVVSNIEWYLNVALPVRFTARTVSTAKNDGHEFTYVYDDNSWFYVDNQTGIPVDMSVKIVTPHSCNSSALANELIQVYADYLGIDFTDITLLEDYSDGYRDSVYRCQAVSADGQIVLVLDISSGWYFTPPQYPGDDWHETDMYEWHVNVNVSSN